MAFHVGEWISELQEHVQEHPNRAPLYFVFTAYLSAWYTLTSRYPLGENVYESEWDPDHSGCLPGRYTW